jgi:hypothetical protein
MADKYEATGEGGKIISPYSQADPSGTVMAKPDGKTITVFSDTIGSDDIFGTAKNDVAVITRPAGAQQSPVKDSIYGGAGNDTVVLPGKQSDWTPKLPGAGDYAGSASKDFWDKGSQAYGRVLVMESKDGRNRVVLRDVENIAFTDGRPPFNKPMSEGGFQRPISTDDMDKFDAGVKSGSIKTMSTPSLLQQAEKLAGPDATESAKFQSTKKAADLLEKIPPMNRPDLTATGVQIGQDLAKDKGFADKVRTTPTMAPLQ